MYILVRHPDNVIIGNATRPVDEVTASANGYKVYEIDPQEWNPEMIGSVLDSFEEE
jgi:hypothetical protein